MTANQAIVIGGSDRREPIRSIHAIITDNKELPTQFRAIYVSNHAEDVPIFDALSSSFAGTSFDLSTAPPRGHTLISIASPTGFCGPVTAFTNNLNPEGQIRLHCLKFTTPDGRKLTLGSTYRGRLWEEAYPSPVAPVPPDPRGSTAPICELEIREGSYPGGTCICTVGIHSNYDEIQHPVITAIPYAEEMIAAQPPTEASPPADKQSPPASGPHVTHHQAHTATAYGPDDQQWCYFIKLCVITLLFLGVVFIMLCLFRRGNRPDPRLPAGAEPDLLSAVISPSPAS